MKNVFLTLALASLIFLSFGAQAQRKADAVHLKNGSIIRGKIIENIEGKNLTIESCGMNLWVFDYEQIEKVVYDERIKNPLSARSLSSFNEKGATMSMEFGFFGSGSASMYGSGVNANVQCALGYQFSNGLGLGGGTGIEFLEVPMIPFYADIRYSFKKRIAPFFYVQSGYAFPLSNSGDDWDPDFKGGFFINPGIGLRKVRNNKNAFIFSIGYLFHESKYEENGYYWHASQTQTTVQYNRVIVKIGYNFR